MGCRDHSWHNYVNSLWIFVLQRLNNCNFSRFLTNWNTPDVYTYFAAFWSAITTAAHPIFFFFGTYGTFPTRLDRLNPKAYGLFHGLCSLGVGAGVAPENFGGGVWTRLSSLGCRICMREVKHVVPIYYIKSVNFHTGGGGCIPPIPPGVIPVASGTHSLTLRLNNTNQ